MPSTADVRWQGKTGENPALTRNGVSPHRRHVPLSGDEPDHLPGRS